MPRVCTICAHEKRAEIDRALVSGESNRRIATQFSLSEASVRRHKAEHVPEQMAKAQQAERVVQADSLLEGIRRLQRAAMGILGRAITAEDYRTALMAIREARGNLELLGKLLGELDERPQVNVLVTSPEWLAMRTAILRALEPYPEARLAVVRALPSAGSSDHAGG